MRCCLLFGLSIELAAFLDLRVWFVWYKLIGPMGGNILDNAYTGMVVEIECMVVHFVVPTSW